MGNCCLPGQKPEQLTKQQVMPGHVVKLKSSNKLNSSSKTRSNNESCPQVSEIRDRSDLAQDPRKLRQSSPDSPLADRLVTENGTLDQFFDSRSYLGIGGFGVVIKGKHYLDQSWYAIKLISFELSKLNKVVREVVNLAATSTHNNVVAYKGCWIEKESCFKDGGLRDKLRLFHRGKAVHAPPYVMCIKMECCTTNLATVLAKRDEKFFTMDKYKVPENEDNLRDGRSFPPSKHTTHKAIFMDILRGLSFLHSKSIIHRDLKPANILVDGVTNDYKITDFGLSRVFESSEEYLTRCGTLIYAAPEQISEKHYDMKVDIFPLGIILFELLYPFKQPIALRQQQDMIVCDKVARIQDLRFRQVIPTGLRTMHPVLSNYITLMVDKRPDMRPSLKDLKEIEWNIF